MSEILPYVQHSQENSRNREIIHVPIIISLQHTRNISNNSFQFISLISSKQKELKVRSKLQQHENKKINFPRQMLELSSTTSMKVQF